MDYHSASRRTIKLARYVQFEYLFYINSNKELSNRLSVTMCRFIMSGNLELEVPLFMEHLKIYFAAEIILYLLHLICKAKKKATVNYLTTKDRLVRKTQQLSIKFFPQLLQSMKIYTTIIAVLIVTTQCYLSVIWYLIWIFF